jgi:hypothetical protein
MKTKGKPEKEGHTVQRKFGRFLDRHFEKKSEKGTKTSNKRKTRTKKMEAGWRIISSSFSCHLQLFSFCLQLFSSGKKRQ